MTRTTRKLKRRVRYLKELLAEHSELLRAAQADILHLHRLVKENTAYINMLVESKDANEVAALLINEGIIDES